jgi:alpha-L-fucosidase
MNYIEGKAVPQVNELLSNYANIDVLWWDTPFGMTEAAALKLKAVTDKYPKLITNNRLYKPWKGDFSTPEQKIPPTGLDSDWEVCMTMNDTWGFKKDDQHWKSPEKLISSLVDIASKGGNFLLNVGPDALGEIPDSSAFALKTMGIWLKKYGESIYGTTASPFKNQLPWGRCTKKVDKNGTTLYLQVFDWPKDQVVVVPGLQSWVNDVYLLANPKQKFAYRFYKGDMQIYVPNVTFDPYCTVIAVKIKGKLKIASGKVS